MDLTERLRQPVANSCRAATGEGVNIGAPGSQRTDPHGHPRVAAVWEGETPLHAAVTRAAFAAAAPALADTGGGHA
jgi:hypothetical protein